MTPRPRRDRVADGAWAATVLTFATFYLAVLLPALARRSYAGER